MTDRLLPWHCVPARPAGVDVLNRSGEQVARFEEPADAEAVVEAMNRQWIGGQAWFRDAVRVAVHEEARRDPH